MQDILIVAIKGLVGGSLVVTFALVSCMIKPKTLAGVFGAAPSIAFAALAATIVTQGPTVASEAASGMIVGACALLLYCVLVAFLTAQCGAFRASVLAMPAWGALAALLYVAMLR